MASKNKSSSTSTATPIMIHQNRFLQLSLYVIMLLVGVVVVVVEVALERRFLEVLWGTKHSLTRGDNGALIAIVGCSRDFDGDACCLLSCWKG